MNPGLFNAAIRPQSMCLTEDPTIIGIQPGGKHVIEFDGSTAVPVYPPQGLAVIRTDKKNQSFTIRQVAMELT